MRIFLHEYVCDEAMTGAAAAASLQAEGRAMRAAVCADFERLPGVQVFGLPRFDETAFVEAARTADYTLVIAPEFDELLATRCHWVEEAGGRLLGPSAAGVQLAGDKLTLARHLHEHGVPTPPCRPWPSDAPLADWPFPAVWKPRYGAGSQATFVVRHAAELPACLARAREESCSGPALVQPFVLGQAASVAFLIGPRQVLPLLPAAQNLSEDGRLHYRGGRLPLAPDLADRARQLALRAVATVPGLHGYVGVDLVLGASADGSTDWIIEINPRLTTSYVGLRALAEGNLAETLLRIAQGEDVADLRWRAGAVTFQADGRVCWEE